MELDRAAEDNGYEDETANERAAEAYQQYNAVRLATQLDRRAAELGKRIVMVGDANGVTAVDTDWLAEQAAMNDLEATQHAASGRY
jgi:hypothetical protein